METLGHGAKTKGDALVTKLHNPEESRHACVAREIRKNGGGGCSTGRQSDG